MNSFPDIYLPPLGGCCDVHVEGCGPIFGSSKRASRRRRGRFKERMRVWHARRACQPRRSPSRETFTQPVPGLNPRGDSWVQLNVEWAAPVARS